MAGTPARPQLRNDRSTITSLITMSRTHKAWASTERTDGAECRSSTTAEVVERPANPLPLPWAMARIVYGEGGRPMKTQRPARRSKASAEAGGSRAACARRVADDSTDGVAGAREVPDAGPATATPRADVTAFFVPGIPLGEQTVRAYEDLCRCAELTAGRPERSARNLQAEPPPRAPTARPALGARHVRRGARSKARCGAGASLGFTHLDADDQQPDTPPGGP